MLLWNSRSYYIHISKGGGDVGAVKDRRKWENKMAWDGNGAYANCPMLDPFLYLIVSKVFFFFSVFKGEAENGF